MEQLRVAFLPEARAASIALDPPELGRLAIRLDLDSGQIRASLRADVPETLATLEAHLPELKALFEQAGVELRDVELSLGVDDSETRDKEEQEAAEREKRGERDGRRANTHKRGLARALAAARLPGAQDGEAGVDLYA